MGIPSPMRRLTRGPCPDFGLEPGVAVPEKPVAPLAQEPQPRPAHGGPWASHRLVVGVCAFAGGPPAARHLAATCSAAGAAVERAWGEIEEGISPRLYVVGGLDSDYRPVATVERFDPRLKAWEGLPPLEVPRAGVCAVVAGGRLYVLGGDAGGQALSDAHRFDPWTQRWESLPAMLAPRIRAGAVAAGTYLFVMGGLDGSRALRSFERYEPRNQRWQELPPMHRARYAPAAAASGRWIFAFGGELSETGCLGSMERYDRETGCWEVLPPIQASGCGAAVTLSPCGRNAFSLGGLGLSGQAQGVAKRLAVDAAVLIGGGGFAEKPEQLRWSCMPPMPTPRQQATAAFFRGSAVVVGGKGAKFEPVGDVVAFSPDRWGWEVLPSLPSPRLRVAVASGRL